MEVYYTRCLIFGHPCLVPFDYESDNSVVSQILVEKLKVPTSFHPNQTWIKFSTRQCVKDAPMDSCHLLLGWEWLHFKALNLDERSIYLRHEGHKMKLKFMIPRQVSKDQHRLNEKIEKEEIENSEGRENEEKENAVERKMTKNFVCQCFFFNSL